MALIDPTEYTKVFADLADKRIGFVPLQGNIGDRLGFQSTYNLFRHFGIKYKIIQAPDLSVDDCFDEIDELVVSGGGNMGGDFYRRPYRTRQELINSGLPITILPQSFIQNEEDLAPYKKVYVRERQSLRLQPECELVPDVALSYSSKTPDSGMEAEVGVFLRTDREQLFGNNPLSLGDPASLCATVTEFFELASKFERIITDRLHFCIAALLLGRKVTLLPNSYFKNRSFYETWLHERCDWRNDLSGINYDREYVENRLLHRLAGPPSKLLPWNDRPIRENGFFLESLVDGFRLIEASGVRLGQSNETSRLVWQLCDGSSSIDGIVELLSTSYTVNRLEVAKDIQKILAEFHRNGAIELEKEPDLTVTGSDKKHRLGIITKASALQLTIREPRIVNQKCHLSATLEGVAVRSRDMCFVIDLEEYQNHDQLADPFLLVTLMYAMRLGRAIKVSGAPISSGLIANLWEFQQAWSSWRKKLNPVDISGTEIIVDRVNNESIVTFSGGVDSCYTIYHSLIDPNRNFQPKVTAAMTIHGFDIPLNEPQTFLRVNNNNKELLGDLNLNFVTVETNIKQFVSKWLDEHGLILAAALSLFSSRFGGAVIAGTLPYTLILPLGSNVVTDRFMGSDGFKIEHHGAGTNRLEKVRALTNWQSVNEYLRVCWSGNKLDRNCRQCIKCVMTAIMFDLYEQTPKCLEGALRKEVVHRVLHDSKISRLDWHDMTCIIDEAAKLNLQKWWLEPIREVIAKYG